MSPLYDHLVRTAVHAVKAEDVATFLGRKLSPAYRDELGNDFGKRIQGTRIRHTMGPASLKMYDKCGVVLRIETTANDVSFFKHHRTVVHRDGTRTFKLAPLRKSIYSMAPDLQTLMAASNQRYLEFISQLEDHRPGLSALDKITASVETNGRTTAASTSLNHKIARSSKCFFAKEFNISGLRNRDIRKHLPALSPARVSHRIKRLRIHGIIKKVGKSYKYYLTALGRRVLATALTLREFVAIPSLAQPVVT